MINIKTLILIKKVMKYILLPVLSLLFLVACSTQKKGIENSEELSFGEKENKLVFEKETQFSKLPTADSLFASIDKGFCFGTCPVYTIKIYKSGYVRYKGVRNVEQEGEFFTTIGYKEMLKFISVAKEIDYMNLKDVYDNEGVTDLPTTITSIVLNGQRKEVRRRYDFPTKILAYEKVFEELLKNGDWKAVRVEE